MICNQQTRFCNTHFTAIKRLQGAEIEELLPSSSQVLLNTNQPGTTMF